ncbi:MAG: isoprenylcysteine carboxylmethyltransferase family protein [Gammaproteobacteria bacterium]|nr:isoprenylcysteine carboxylmethyltransferase family protein [Gammaproteobacteria bacterium]
MGSRTRDLPPRTGIAHIIRELRYSEAGRQYIGLLLMPVFALLGDPESRSFLPGLLLACSGLLVRLYASGYIVKNQELATTGPYSVVRHPLYLGNLLLLAGFGVMSDRWWALPVAVLFWLFYYPPAIEYEDRKLRRIFGPACAEWQRRTPAVLPSCLLPKRDGQWSLRTSMRRNAEPLVIAYSVAWLTWLFIEL